MNERIFSNKEIFIFFIILILEFLIIIEIEYHFSYKEKKISMEHNFQQDFLPKKKQLIIVEEIKKFKTNSIPVDIPINNQIFRVENKVLFEIDDNKKEEYELLLYQ